MLRKIGLFSRARPGESLGAPGEPIDRIMLVLQQVGRFLARQAVGVGRDHNRMENQAERGGQIQRPSIIAAESSPV